MNTDNVHMYTGEEENYARQYLQQQKSMYICIYISLLILFIFYKKI